MYLAMDMGTSNTRLWLCENTEIRNFIKIPVGAGITKSKGKDFLFSEIKNLINNILNQSNISANNIDYIIASGMVGSELGLKEVDRLEIPADISVLTKNLRKHTIPEITTIPFLFVPGLKKSKNNKLLDVIRGEETETMGILQDLNLKSDIVLVLPGTHNKIIFLTKDGTITDFYTSMSGELLHNIITNTILSGVVSHQFEPDKDFVLKGALDGKKLGINAALFQIRVMSLNGVDCDKLSSYLYGCILGQDIETIIKPNQNVPVFVGGNERLKKIYSILIGEIAKPLCQELSDNATRIGLSKMIKSYYIEKA